MIIFPFSFERMIIYTFPVHTAFIERDVEMLSPEHTVKALEFTQNPKTLPFHFIKQFFQLLWFLPKTDQYLCFFGGYHSVLPVWFARAFGKRCTIQAGGTDCMNMPEINYGNFRKKWLRKATVYSFKNCHKILPVAQALVKQQYQYDPRISPSQGLLNLIPDLETPIQVIPNGFDIDFWVDQGNPRPELSFVTVAAGTSNPTRGLIKGYDLIKALARNNPDWKFTLIGDPDYHSSESNVDVKGKLNKGELLKELNKHQFYLQLSVSEGFPNALAEAMSCGCIPIGSDVGAIREIIGGSGFINEKKSIDPVIEWVDELKKEEPHELRLKARKRITENYTFEERKNALISALNQRKDG